MLTCNGNTWWWDSVGKGMMFDRVEYRSDGICIYRKY